MNTWLDLCQVMCSEFSCGSLDNSQFPPTEALVAKSFNKPSAVFPHNPHKFSTCNSYGILPRITPELVLSLVNFHKPTHKALCWEISVKRTFFAEAQTAYKGEAHGTPAGFFKKNQDVKSNYCRASIRRVMVRFNSLSERRNSSILLMECKTVVWCLPPNWRPISGSDAVVNCLTMYMAT